MEMIVVISIFTMLTASMVMNLRTSTKTMMLKTLAERIVTELRQAQTYSLGNVKGSAATFGIPYGVNFNTATNNTIIFFRDDSGDGTYNSGTDTLIETVKFNTGNTITGICVNLKKNGACTAVNVLDVTFTRPYPEPEISSASCSAGSPCGDAEITLTSDNGTTKTIVVWMTGQLAIE